MSSWRPTSTVCRILRRPKTLLELVRDHDRSERAVRLRDHQDLLPAGGMVDTLQARAFLKRLLVFEASLVAHVAPVSGLMSSQKLVCALVGLDERMRRSFGNA